MPRERTCECGSCKTCRNRERARQWYAKNAASVRERVRRYREENVDAIRKYDRERGWRVYDAEKTRARTRLNWEILEGKITKQPCEVCGSEQVHGHHEDYSKPLEVRWLCSRHHAQVHWRFGDTP